MGHRTLAEGGLERDGLDQESFKAAYKATEVATNGELRQDTGGVECDDTGRGQELGPLKLCHSAPTLRLSRTYHLPATIILKGG